MKKTILSLFITLFLFTGCSKTGQESFSATNKETTETPTQSAEKPKFSIASVFYVAIQKNRELPSLSSDDMPEIKQVLPVEMRENAKLLGDEDYIRVFSETSNAQMEVERDLGLNMIVAAVFNHPEKAKEYFEKFENFRGDKIPVKSLQKGKAAGFRIYQTQNAQGRIFTITSVEPFLTIQMETDTPIQAENMLKQISAEKLKLVFKTKETTLTVKQAMKEAQQVNLDAIEDPMAAMFIRLMEQKMQE